MKNLLYFLASTLIFASEVTIELNSGENILLPKEVTHKIKYLDNLLDPELTQPDSIVSLKPINENVTDQSFKDLVELLKFEARDPSDDFLEALSDDKLKDLVRTIQYLGSDNAENKLLNYFGYDPARFLLISDNEELRDLTEKLITDYLNKFPAFWREARSDISENIEIDVPEKSASSENISKWLMDNREEIKKVKKIKIDVDFLEIDGDFLEPVETDERLSLLPPFLNFFEDVFKLNFQYNTLTKVKLKNFKKILKINLRFNQLVNITLHLPTLKGVNLNGNKLSSIDLSLIDSLEDIDISDNKFESIEIIDHPNLKKVNCFNNILRPNPLEKVAVANVPTLEDLHVESFKLKELNIESVLPNLKRLVLTFCKITSLDFSKMPNLEELEVSCNKEIQNLNISNLLNLRILKLYRCDNLQSLILKNLPKLEALKVNDNPNLFVLRLQYLPKLKEFSRSNTPITEDDRRNFSRVKRQHIPFEIDNRPKLT